METGEARCLVVVGEGLVIEAGERSSSLPLLMASFKQAFLVGGLDRDLLLELICVDGLSVASDDL